MCQVGADINKGVGHFLQLCCNRFGPRGI
jgi:hypothetical protein